MTEENENNKKNKIPQAVKNTHLGKHSESRFSKKVREMNEELLKLINRNK